MRTIIVIITIAISSYCTDAKTDKKDLGTVIGIDLGTTYTCVGIFKNCHVEVIENEQGNRITPSYVAFQSNGERLIGDAAKNLLTSNPENTIFHVKRLIGRKFNESSVQEDIKNFPFLVTEKNNKLIIKINTNRGEKEFTPEEISAMILAKMRTIAEEYLREKVKNAVITVPAYFNNAQRQATKDAGTIAGLNVLRIINEPTAAAIAYGLDKLNVKEGAKNILVFDLGGGTFDVSVLTLDNGAFEVLATNGNTHLGGEDFDQRVIDHFIKIFKTKTGKYAGKDIRSLQKLRREVEKAKRILSFEHQTKIEIESFFQNNDFSETLTRAKFEELNNDLFQSTLIPVEQAMKDARLKKSDISEVILVGGSTRIPKVRQILKEYFNGKEPSRSVNPDEAVAHGAAIQAGILSGEDCKMDIVVVDINPLTLGIETTGGVMSELIPRNSPIPTEQTKPFTTVADDQQSVNIEIFEGERSMSKDNHFLGSFVLTGIPPAPRGIPQIDVTFDIDVNGILNVTAQEKSIGIKKNIIINSKTNRLSTQEIDRMIKEAERFAEQDKKIKDRIDGRNDFESYVYSVKNQLNDNTKPLGRLSIREQTTIEYHVDKQLQWLDANSDAKLEDIIKHKDQFEEIVSEIINEINRRGPNSNDTHSDEL